MIKGPKMTYFPKEKDTKMAPTWLQDGSKMASWRVLGACGGQDSPKMEPRGFQERKSEFVTLMLGPKMGPNFGHCRYQSGLEEVSRTTAKTCSVKTPIVLNENAPRGTPADMKNQAKP